MSRRFILQRLLQMALTLFGLSVIVFALARLTGDPVSLMLSQEATPEDIARVRHTLGLDQPYLVQYLHFVRLAVVGDLGTSITWKAPVSALLIERFPATMVLAGCSMIFAVLLALPLGIASAVRRDSWLDTGGKLVALVGQSMPTFWIGMVLILLFSLKLPLLPSSGYGTVAHVVLPAITLGSFVAASIMRITRSSMLDVLATDYIRTARSKGLSERRVVWDHALRNAAIPILTITTLQAAMILRGAVVTETVFAWPGIGKIAIDAVYNRDFPLVQGAVLFMGALLAVVNLVVDLLYAVFDPRIRLMGGRNE
ncbi:MAG: ABC transporter permease [Pseudorhodoplanes sp.]|uniref:ABC transporter permease n=1 Tax=Pseudorhodoplanes sp. TaxID=1934341 RepID=UPI003D0AF0A6